MLTLPQFRGYLPIEMATDQHPQSGRRQHFHRGRRGQERRGDRRPSTAPQTQEQGKADQPDVDQIVKDIKARIAQRHGIDLSAQQIQELAARRLEAILDPRTVKPGLLDQLRKAAGAPADIAPAAPADAYTFEDHTIYDTHNGLLRFLRKLLAPVLKLFFNPNPIAAALNAQVRVNREASRREAERERTQAEWNALHYTVLQRLVTEVSRVSLEMQSLSLRVESLATRADFAERRIRGLEAPPAAPAVPARTFDTPATPAGPARQPSDIGASASTSTGTGTGTSEASEGRRRRRRRRGRRGNLPGGDAAGAGAPTTQTSGDLADGDDEAFDDGPESDGPEADDSTPSSLSAPAPGAPEPAAEASFAGTSPGPASFAAIESEPEPEKALRFEPLPAAEPVPADPPQADPAPPTSEPSDR